MSDRLGSSRRVPSGLSCTTTTHLDGQCLILEEAADGEGESRNIAGGHQDTINPVTYERRNPPDAGGYHWSAGGHGFNEYCGETFVVRGQSEHACSLVRAGQRESVEPAGKRHVLSHPAFATERNVVRHAVAVSNYFQVH